MLRQGLFIKTGANYISLLENSMENQKIAICVEPLLIHWLSRLALD
jgi:hypothetical protein